MYRHLGIVVFQAPTAENFPRAIEIRKLIRKLIIVTDYGVRRLLRWRNNRPCSRGDKPASTGGRQNDSYTRSNSLRTSAFPLPAPLPYLITADSNILLHRKAQHHNFPHLGHLPEVLVISPIPQTDVPHLHILGRMSVRKLESRASSC